MVPFSPLWKRIVVFLHGALRALQSHCGRQRAADSVNRWAEPVYVHKDTWEVVKRHSESLWRCSNQIMEIMKVTDGRSKYLLFCLDMQDTREVVFSSQRRLGYRKHPSSVSHTPSTVWSDGSRSGKTPASKQFSLFWSVQTDGENKRDAAFAWRDECVLFGALHWKDELPSLAGGGPASLKITQALKPACTLCVPKLLLLLYSSLEGELLTYLWKPIKTLWHSHFFPLI